MSKRSNYAPEAVIDKLIDVDNQVEPERPTVTTAGALPQDNGLFLYPEDLHALGKLLACQICTKDDLLTACTRLTTISVDGLPIQLDPALITRLKSRCINREFGPYLKEQIVRLLCMDIGF